MKEAWSISSFVSSPMSCNIGIAVATLGGRYLAHGRALSATSWREFGVMVLAYVEGVVTINAHMCRYGVAQMASDGFKCANGPARFLSNPLAAANELNK